MSLAKQFSLQDSVAIVTGAAAGIGRGIATTFAQAGATVVVTDLRGAGAEAVAQEIEANGGRAMGLECDVTQESHLTSIVQRALEAFGKIDVLVNNAGGGGPKPAMERAGGGAIVNISSMAGENKNVRMASYALCFPQESARAGPLACSAR